MPVARGERFGHHWRMAASVDDGTGEPNAATGGPDLSTTTIFFLFATLWLAAETDVQMASVPAGRVPERTAYANLVHCALWDLEDRGLVRLEQVSVAQPKGPVLLGGASNVHVHVLDRHARPRGLEGRLLDAARAVRPAEGWLETKIQAASQEHHLGVRNVLAELGVSYARPWQSISSPCFTQLVEHGLVEQRGRMTKRIVVTDVDAVHSLRPRFDALRAARKATMDANPALGQAVVQDGLISYQTHHDPRGA
jgi:hypothetical protein